MAWIMVIKGISATINEFNYNDLSELTSKKEYKELEKEATKYGLKIFTDSDDENKKSVIFFGEDLHEDRYFYKNQTETFDIDNKLKDEIEKFKPIFENYIKNNISRAIIKTGLIINHFD